MLNGPIRIFTRGEIAKMAGVKQHQVENVVRLRHLPHQYQLGTAAGYTKEVADVIAGLVKIHKPRHELPMLQRTLRFIQDELRNPALDPAVRAGFIKDIASEKARVLKSYADNVYFLLAGTVADIDPGGFVDLYEKKIIGFMDDK